MKRRKFINVTNKPNRLKKNFILSLYLICILQALQPYLNALLELLSVSTEFTNLLTHRLDLQHLRQKLHFLCH